MGCARSWCLLRSQHNHRHSFLRSTRLPKAQRSHPRHPRNLRPHSLRPHLHSLRLRPRRSPTHHRRPRSLRIRHPYNPCRRPHRRRVVRRTTRHTQHNRERRPPSRRCPLTARSRPRHPRLPWRHPSSRCPRSRRRCRHHLPMSAKIDSRVSTKPTWTAVVSAVHVSWSRAAKIPKTASLACVGRTSAENGSTSQVPPYHPATI